MPDPVQEHHGMTEKKPQTEAFWGRLYEMTESKAGYRLQGLGSGEQKQVADSQLLVLLRTSS